MLMILGIDTGASFTDVVLMRGEKIIAKFSAESKGLRKGNSFSLKKIEHFLKLNLKKQKIPISKINRISITGSHFFPKKILSIPVQRIDEITAISLGAKYLSKKSNFIVANIGTGTPFISVRGKKFSHLGGTGIGGGTLEGLAKLLAKCKICEIESLGTKGKNSLDLTVRDIIKGKVGIIPADATASNFGKISAKAKKSDLAFSLQNMVAETIGVMACLASSKSNSNLVVFTGRVAKNKLVKKRISAALKLFKVKGIFPANPEYCTAIGAALIGFP